MLVHIHGRVLRVVHVEVRIHHLLALHHHHVRWNHEAIVHHLLLHLKHLLVACLQVLLDYVGLAFHSYVLFLSVILGLI